MKNEMYPGKCETDHVEYPAYIRRVLKFMGPLNIVKVYFDIGPVNAKTMLIRQWTGIQLVQITREDFNIDRIGYVAGDIFCFEILEHLQNQLFFMKELAGALHPHASIWLTMPYVPRWMRSPFHFHEMPPKHFNKWLAIPAGLRIVRFKKIKAPYRLHNFGIRPLLRWLLSYTYIYELKHY